MANPNLLTFLTLSAFFALLSSPEIQATNVLYSSLRPSLAPGASLTYNQYTLTMRTDCNLVLLDGKNQIWSTGTAGRGRACSLNLLSNGELIIYLAKSLIPLWRSNAKSVEGSYALVLQYDGSLHVYGPSMWTNPIIADAGKTSTESPWPSTTDSVLWAGDVAPVGTTIISAKHKLFLHDNCNLTLSVIESGRVLWFTDTFDKNHLVDCYVSLEANGEATGELMVKYMGGLPLWRNGVNSTGGGYVLALQPDGKLVVYGPSIWSNKAALPVESSSGEKIAMVTEE